MNNEDEKIYISSTVLEGELYISSTSLLRACEMGDGGILQSDIEDFVTQSYMGIEGLPLRDGVTFHERTIKPKKKQENK